MNAAWLIAPILIPLAAAALQLLAGPQRRRTLMLLSWSSPLCLLAVAGALVVTAGIVPSAATLAYHLGAWPAPVAIVLVADRLTALLLLLSAMLALAVMPSALARAQQQGAHFQPLLQLLLLGLNGAFLAGDLFNLFVFFEVLLAASYGLALHGSGARRVGASLHYIAINLVASMLFLLGVSIIFGVTGSLNMALLGELVPTLAGRTRVLFHTGAALLALAFLIKTAVWPLGFWLPRTYSAASPPVAALFSIMTKVGIYVLLRLGLLWFGADAGPASAHYGATWLLAIGMATIVVASLGVLGARDLGKLAGYCVLVSSGILLGAIALQQPAVTAGALAYLVVSVLGLAALFLLTGLIVRPEEPEASAQLEPYDPASDILFSAEDESRVRSPASVVVLSACFLGCGLLLAGLPPLPGFLAKFALLPPMLAAGPGGYALFALIITAGLCVLIAMCRAGIQLFWASPERVFPVAEGKEVVAVVTLLLVCLLLGVLAAVPWQYLAATANQLHNPHHYIDAVLQSRVTVTP